ncbi:MAG: DNA-deoxyinosine glycosylase [Gammaproteobacteria bacterium]|nr:DNA-deoxyinosine glycosylase [Gammaproteobacteria bacterium]NND53455.1 DNA-deoxyinosine glycosylase [Gammaproteobacteria bacterium]
MGVTRLQGFPPLVGDAPKVLILGSMPSVASLQKLQYYGKPQNAFWRIMGELFAAGPELDYDTRVQRLTVAGVAVWDVIARCHRPGSLDSAIDMASVEVNDFPALLSTHPTLHSVFFNGRKAEETWRRFVQADAAAVRSTLAYHALPSTSPAMAALNFAAKLKRWQVVKEKVET